MNVLLIQANQKLYESKGELNNALFTQSKEYFLGKNHDVFESCIAEGGWEVKDEVSKLKQADLIVYHFPLWWFGVPNLLKRYFDEILLHRETFVVTDIYGEGGLLTEKKFMLVVTSNMKKSDFQTTLLLERYNSIDDILTQVILTNHYLGVRGKLPTFHADNVIKGDTSGLASAYFAHLCDLGLDK